MTDLLSRPTSSATPAPRPSPPVPRPLTVSAAVSGAGAALGGLLLCLAVALTGWFLADAGGHGRTTDALRVGADAWLLGHGSRMSLAGAPIGVVPLGLTLLLAVVSYRSGRWAGATSQEIEDDRSLALGATIHTGLYLVVTVVVAVLAGTTDAAPGVGRAIVGSLLVGGLTGTLGLATGSGRWAHWLERLPLTVLDVARAALTTLVGLLLVSGLVVVASLVHHLGQAATAMSALHLSPGDAVMYVLVTLAAAPNAALLGSAYLLGPGFAVGTGTIVSPTAVALGPVPAFPLLAALPGEGPTPGWLVVVVGVPALVAALGAARVQRRYPTRAWDQGALRGFGSGVVAAVVLTLLVALAGGPMGTGRMADFGAPFGEVLMTALAALGLGGLAGGLVTTWWQRRTLEDVEDRDPDVEDTVGIPLLGGPLPGARDSD